MNLEQLAEAVCEVHGVGEDELYGKRRKKKLVFARQMMMLFMKQEMQLRVADIARHFGYHHTSILHGVRCCENDVFYFEEFRERYNSVWCRMYS